MKLRDNKKTRNYRIWKEKSRARDKLENLIGVDIGVNDKDGNPIRSGCEVEIYNDNYTWNSIVLYHRDQKCYCALRGLWNGDKNKYDPDSYGKIDYMFDKKGLKIANNIKIISYPEIN